MLIEKFKGGYKNNVSLVEINKQKYVLIPFDLNSKIELIHNTVDSIVENKLPIRKLIKVRRSTKSIHCVFNYLPGDTISWDSYTQKHIKLLGIAMSNLHFYLRNIKSDKFDNGVDIQISNCLEMHEYFKDFGVISALNKKLGLKINVKFNSYLKILKSLNKLEKQLLHLDLVRGNVLFISEKEIKEKNLDSKLFLTLDKKIYLSGILDLEKVALGPTILDISRTLAFLIVDCKYKEEVKVRKYFLKSGYEKRGETKLKNIEYLEGLMEYFWLYDFFKFLYYTPYESLVDNEHFIRTRDKLLSLNLLTYSHGNKRMEEKADLSK